MSVRETASDFVARLRRIDLGEPLFERRGADRIRRPNVSDEPTERRRRIQRILGLGFVVLLGLGIWNPFVAVAGIATCMAGAVGVATVRGRFWCNYMCPRGGFLDGYLRFVSRGRRTPDWFKHPLTRIAFAMLIAGVLGSSVLAAWGNPSAMALPFVTMLVVSTTLAVGLGVVFHERAWCQICPAGTFAHLVNRVADSLGREPPAPVQVDAGSCVSCGRCGSVCRQEIRPGQYDSGTVTDHGDILEVGGTDGATRTADGGVEHYDCMQCADCVRECPMDALSMSEQDSEEHAV